MISKDFFIDYLTNCLVITLYVCAFFTEARFPVIVRRNYPCVIFVTLMMFFKFFSNQGLVCYCSDHTFIIFNFSSFLHRKFVNTRQDKSRNLFFFFFEWCVSYISCRRSEIIPFELSLISIAID